jgi:hypothetical protein
VKSPRRRSFVENRFLPPVEMTKSKGAKVKSQRPKANDQRPTTKDRR